MKVIEFFVILVFVSVQPHGTDSFVCPDRTLYATRTSKYFISPGFPLGYPNFLDCSWTLQAPVGHDVEIIFLEVLTETCCDIIELRDGNSSSAGLLATYRGNATESIYASSFGSLHVRFTSDDSHVYYGFFAEYRIATTDPLKCTTDLEATALNESLSSPGWPIQYRNNLHCKWTIHAPKGHRVAITFMYLETESCCDFVLVRLGDTMNAKVYELGGSIGEDVNPTYMSPSEKMQVVFRSDRTLTRKGFYATFRAVKEDALTNSKKGTRQGKCGGKLNVTRYGHQVFTTPNYPAPHANGLDCVWILAAPLHFRIVLWFTSVHTEECCDFIKIRDGESTTSRKIGVLSGQNIMYESFISTKNRMRVRFQSDMTNTNRGFRAAFEAIQDSNNESCGGTRRASTGMRKYLSTPNWPYSPNTDQCVWNISGPVGTVIRFTVIGFHTGRYREELLFYNKGASEPFATMNGRSSKARFTSSSNVLLVVFNPDFTSIEGGFRGLFKAVHVRDILMSRSDEEMSQRHDSKPF